VSDINASKHLMLAEKSWSGSWEQVLFTSLRVTLSSYGMQAGQRDPSS